MQINGIGNNQIGNSYQNPNRMPNSTAGKKEDDVNKRLEALGVKVELSFQQAEAQEQEVVKESVETEKTQESFSVLDWIKKIWDAGIAWLKGIWNDEDATAEEKTTDFETAQADAEMFDAEAELVAEAPLTEDTSYAVVHAKEPDQEIFAPDKFRTVGTPLHTSGMQDSYNRYGQHSKLGVESSNNMQMRK